MKDCTTCKAILSGTKRCRECINERALSINDVYKDYPGWLWIDIIAERSHNTNKEKDSVRNDATDSAGTSDGGHELCPVEQQQVAVGAEEAPQWING